MDWDTACWGGSEGFGCLEEVVGRWVETGEGGRGCYYLWSTQNFFFAQCGLNVCFCLWRKVNFSKGNYCIRLVSGVETVLCCSTQGQFLSLISETFGQGLVVVGCNVCRQKLIWIIYIWISIAKHEQWNWTIELESQNLKFLLLQLKCNENWTLNEKPTVPTSSHLVLTIQIHFSKFIFNFLWQTFMSLKEGEEQLSSATQLS